jgi:hypothetical protein
MIFRSKIINLFMNLIFGPTNFQLWNGIFFNSKGEDAMDFDLRNHPRFRVREQTFAGLLNRESEDVFQLGQIVDISMGGLCLQYIATQKDEEVASHINIFGRSDKLINVERIPCKIVYDINIPSKGWIKIPEMRSGVEFLSRTSSQEKQIENFMKTFTVEPSM